VSAAGRGQVGIFDRHDVGQQGWLLHTIFEQGKNTIIVLERMIPSPQWGATQPPPPQGQQPPPWASR
jgi:hypothetical protein